MYTIHYKYTVLELDVLQGRPEIRVKSEAFYIRVLYIIIQYTIIHIVCLYDYYTMYTVVSAKEI